MKSTKRLSAALLGLSLVVASAAAAGEHLHGFEIRRALSGVTLDGIYHDGTFFSETYNEDGTIRYHDRDGADSGHWEVVRDTFCTYYDSQQGACFYVDSDGANCFTFYQAVEGTSRRATPVDAWNSRGWNREQQATCPKPPAAEI
jgi:hypothetical protein